MRARLYDERGEGPERPQSIQGGGTRPKARHGIRATIRRWLAYLGAFAVLALALSLWLGAGLVSAASPSPGPSASLLPSPDPASSQRVFDKVGLFSSAAVDNAEALIEQVQATTGGKVFVITAAQPTDPAATLADANGYLAAWTSGGASGHDLVMLWNAGTSGRDAPEVQIARGTDFVQFLPDDERDAIVDDSMASYLAAGNYDSALTAGLSRLYLDVQVMASGGCVGSACPIPVPTLPGVTAAPTAGSNATPGPTRTPRSTTAPRPEVPAGPPYPPPTTGRRVYDQAGVFRQDTRDKIQATADAIEQRTGAQVVVYTQVKPGVTTDEAEQDAIALMDQWGIGRKGFDDGLVILFDLDNSLKHGQVQLYAGPGFRATFLSNGDRQAIFENDMLPFLRQGDLDGAVLVAMARVDAAATPSHAQQLEFARQVNAVIGLVGGPVLFLLLAGWAVFAWFRHGRDPHYLDDPSVYMAGPPVDLTPASGAFILENGPSRRALTAALLDLASRGEVSFRQDDMGMYGDVGLAVQGKVDAASAAIANARPLGTAESTALDDLRVLAHSETDGYLDPKALRGFGLKVDNFNAALERQVIGHGWYAEAPRVSRNRWLGRGVLEIFLGIVAFFIASIFTISGVTLVGLALVGAGVVTFILSFSMPARTMAGAMVQAMLLAYRRTLAKTMDTARSMNQVVAEAQLPWLRTPDQAMVWATAVGLQPQVDAVLARSLEDLQAQPSTTPSNVYFPTWYAPMAVVDSGGAGGSGGVSEGRGGLFSSSAVPNFGSMLAALGTIGNAPVPTSSSSGGGGSFSSGGSFGGGSSGGGGGGAGGGF
jgi:uncharacterized membrane protein YgcG